MELGRGYLMAVWVSTWLLLGESGNWQASSKKKTINKNHVNPGTATYTRKCHNNNNIGHLYCAATIIIYSTAHYNSSHKTCIILIT